MYVRLSWANPQGRREVNVDAVGDANKGCFRFHIPPNMPPGQEILVEMFPNKDKPASSKPKVPRGESPPTSQIEKPE